MSYKKLIISLLILFLILISTGCLGKLIPTTPSVTPPGTAGVLYLEPANLTLTPSQDFTVELKASSITNPLSLI
jgi:PBP1b-binding outer membrane lipoprotein LpoB